MTAEQEAISEFRRGERVGPTRVYKCFLCGIVSREGGLDMSPVDDGEGVCNDCRACDGRRAKAVRVAKTSSPTAWMDKPKTITAGELDHLEGDRMTLDKLRVEIRKIGLEEMAWLRVRNAKLFDIVVRLTSVVAVDDEETARIAQEIAESQS